MAEGVRFVRVNGRVVPLKGKGSAPQGTSKRYGAKREITKTKQIGVGKGAAAGALAGIAATWKNPNPKMALKATLLGALGGAALGSIKVMKKGKGESNKQVAKRITGEKVKSKLQKTGV
jgi:phage tail tape-measure protein